MIFNDNPRDFTVVEPLEDALIGTLLKDTTGTKFFDVIDKLMPEHFYSSVNSIVFTLMQSILVEKSYQTLDIAVILSLAPQDIVRDHIQKLYNGQEYYISNIDNVIEEILNVSRLRKLGLMSIDINEDVSFSKLNAGDIIDKYESRLFSLSELRSDSFIRPAQCIGDTLSTLQSSSDVIGIPTYLKSLDEMTNGFEPGTLVVIAGRPSMGKCSSFNTPTLMYDGTIKMVQDVKVGDQLMGDDSAPRNVLSLARGRDQMYWVRQGRGGIDYRVNESHVLSLRKGRQDGPGNRGDIIDIPLIEYMSKNNKFKSSWKGYSVPVEFPKKEQLLEPYFIGVWLGDGDCCRSYITNSDTEIIEYLKSYAKQLGNKIVIAPDRNTFRIRMHNMLSHLRELNILNNKHIPHNYLTGSTEQRLQLLAGLLDTDGHLQKEFNCFEITQKNETLAKQIEFLCNTLGFKVSFHAKQATIKDRNFECTVYRVRISGDIDRVPTKVPYKQARPKSMRRNHLNVGITIEKDIVDDYYGFVIDGNSRYLHGDCTVTHNTLIALQIALENTSRGVPIGFFSLEMTKKMIMERLLSYMCRIPMHKIRSRNVSDRELEFAQENVEKIKSLDLIIDPKSHLTPQQFISRARRMKMQYKDLGLICVDYLQLMSAPGVKESREKEIAYIAQTLKRVAIDLDIPVIGVSQLSRAVEQRENKRPILSDLRESGAIEQISDIVMFMYRPGYYSGDKTDHSAEIIVAKNRNGPTGRVELTEELVIQRFTEE